MRDGQTPQPSPVFSGDPSIQGDSATRTFGLFFLGALAMVTIGAGIGIGVGNLAHYRYYGPYNQTNITNTTLINVRFARAITARLWSPISARLKKRESGQRFQDFWLMINKLSNDDDHPHY